MYAAEGVPRIFERARIDAMHRGPLIFFQVVLPHPTDRVLRQFTIIQTVPSSLPPQWGVRNVRARLAPRSALHDWAERGEQRFVVFGRYIDFNTDQCKLYIYLFIYFACVITYTVSYFVVDIQVLGSIVVIAHGMDLHVCIIRSQYFQSHDILPRGTLTRYMNGVCIAKSVL